MKDHKNCIYMSISPVNHFYIGYTTLFSRRKKQHKSNYLNKNYKGYNNSLYKALRKYGFKSFVWVILEENIPEDKLPEREKYWINYYNTYQDPNHYNMTEGGEISPMKYPEVVKKVSEATKGKRHWDCRGDKNPMKRPEVVKKISQLNKGDKNPMKRPEVAKKNSEVQKGKPRYDLRHDLWNIAEEIRQEYYTTTISYKNLAKKYNCGYRTILRIIKNDMSI